MTSVAERVTRTESQTRVRHDAVPRKRKARRFSLRRVPFYLLIALIFVYTVFPFYWAIRSALTAQGDLFRTPVQYIPLEPTLDNLGRAFSQLQQILPGTNDQFPAHRFEHLVKLRIVFHPALDRTPIDANFLRRAADMDEDTHLGPGNPPHEPLEQARGMMSADEIGDLHVKSRRWVCPGSQG